MEKLRRLSQSSRRDIIFGIIAVVVIIADQFTKWWIRENVDFLTVFYNGGFFQIVHFQNTGISFGLFKDHIEIIIAVVFLEILVVLAVVYFLRSRLAFMDSMLMRVGLGLITGGAIGNQIDRIAQGHVTDFIDFKVWPAFNIADASAVVGTIIIAYCIIFKYGLMKQRE